MQAVRDKQWRLYSCDKKHTRYKYTCYFHDIKTLFVDFFHCRHAVEPGSTMTGSLPVLSADRLNQHVSGCRSFVLGSTLPFSLSLRLPSHSIFSAAIQVSSNYWGPIGIGFSIFDAAAVEIARCQRPACSRPRPPSAQRFP